MGKTESYIVRGHFEVIQQGRIAQQSSIRCSAVGAFPEEISPRDHGDYVKSACGRVLPRILCVYVYTVGYIDANECFSFDM